uniref:Uncharacterized protein n=1 Tax=Theropithecus gelada TaxID=9565 RepID=A0A8D2FUP8_THEGE
SRGSLLEAALKLAIEWDCCMAHAEQKLMDDLLNKTRYNYLIRPATSSSQLVSIETELSLAQCSSMVGAEGTCGSGSGEEATHAQAPSNQYPEE